MKIYNQSDDHPDDPQYVTSINAIETEYAYTIINGYDVITNNHKKFINSIISEGQLCCEVYGAYITDNLKEKTSDDVGFDTDKYIGAKIIDVEYVVKKANDDYYDMQSNVTVSINTTNGKFHIIVFNEHNGYYPHDYRVTVNGVIKKGRI